MEIAMELAQQVRLAPTKLDVPGHDMSIILGYAALAMLMLAAIYFAGGGPGMGPADFANLTVFP
jgi:hypothetical protein